MKCCHDFELCVDNYKKISINGDVVRFAESVITYCPFCGKKLKDTIEELHTKQNAFIKTYKLKTGDIVLVQGKTSKNLLTVKHIHPLYGWIQAEDNKGNTAHMIPIENILEVYNKNEMEK